MTPSGIQPDARTSEQAKLSQENFQYLCRAIYDDAGIVLDESKGYLLEARLAPLARHEGADTLNDLCNLMRAVGGNRVRERVVEAMTTNETLFFRDLRPFEAIEKTLLPELRERNAASRKIRVWSAACSTGQEPYSLAMLWRETQPPNWEIEILATDLSDEVLARARAGRFMQLEVNRGLPAPYLVKYFRRQGLDWEIDAEIRRMVIWRKFNLQEEPRGLGRFDLVLCRNVLIYFDQPAKRAILGRLRGVLVPGGYLLLGASETTLGSDETFVRKQAGQAVVYQNPS
jgi:chemotaxis protein methyltransferase CheR